MHSIVWGGTLQLAVRPPKADMHLRMGATATSVRSTRPRSDAGAVHPSGGLEPRVLLGVVVGHDAQDSTAQHVTVQGPWRDAQELSDSHVSVEGPNERVPRVQRSIDLARKIAA